MADILEIALVAAESIYAFHSYVKIHYSAQKRVQRLTCIANKTIKYLGNPFRAHSESTPIIIAHGGYLHDIPILFPNCMKHNYDWTLLMKVCMFVDSIRVLQNSGYKRTGLDAFCQDSNIYRNRHFALGYAYILKPVCISVILCHVDQELPLPIQIVYDRWLFIAQRVNTSPV